MMVSILIAVKEKNGRLEECLRACLKLSYRDMEIIVLPDAAFACDEARVRVIATGPCLPADKRDIGARHARGALLAFLDDDAYPSPGWLEPAVALFRSDPRLGAVGGPAVTPPDEPPACKASGLVYASWAVSGTYRYRYLPQPARAIDDYPSCNLLVRKDAFLTLGGFRTKFWPGEDTVLCLGIVRELGLKIVYDPAVLVYHHRRALFGPHLRQIASYATHRGYFVKRFPQTSLRWAYFMPSLFLAFLLAGPFILPRPVFMAFIGAYAALVAAACLRDRRTAGLVFLGIVASHATYGLYFMRGLLTPRLAEEKTNNT